MSTANEPATLAGPGFSIRPARPEDCATIANLVHELAVYEELEQFARATAGLDQPLARST